MCLSIFGFVYIIGTLTVPLISDRIQKRLVLMCSALGLGIFLFLVGPSQILGFPDSFTLLIVGLVIVANFLAPVAIPALPEMIDAIKDRYPNCNIELAGNYASGLLNSGNNLGQVVGPFFGATMYSAVGFRLTQDTLAISCIVFAVLYFFLAEGKLAFS